MSQATSGIDPNLIPTFPDALPVSGEDQASLPRRERLSLHRTSQYFWNQYINGLAARRHHAVAWIMVRSFLRGIHYFNINSLGQWIPVPPKGGEIRAATPVMKSMIRHVSGFLSGNPLGVSTIPLSGSSKSLHQANRTEAILNNWIEDANVAAFKDRAEQLLLTEGMVGMYRYLDFFRENVFMKALPASEMFPVPFDVRDPTEQHGFMHASMVTRQWLELQDEIFEQQTGKPPTRRMADKASQHQMGMRLDLPLVGTGGPGGKYEGALALQVWMRKSEKRPLGEYLFMVGDEIFRYASDANPETGGPQVVKALMPDGMEPVEIVYYDKNPEDWWGTGLAEAELASQFTVDRMMTHLEQSARSNRGMTFYDTEVVNQNDIQSQSGPLIPMDLSKFDSVHNKPVYHYPAQPVSRDVTASLEAALKFSDLAAGFRSGIVFGQQEGRTESGPATNLLSQNAMASLDPAIKRLDRAWTKTYRKVLDLLHFVWPAEKVVRLSGSSNVGREIKILKDELPKSEEVLIRARPLLPGGRNTLASILFQLRQMPGEDGTQGTEVSSKEFRQALSEMNLLPPGLELADKAAARIQNRINLLIGDGKKPGMAPSNPGDSRDRLAMENHKLAAGMLRDVILDDSFLIYDDPVKRALVMQHMFHHQRVYGATTHPNSFDDDLEKLESMQTEQYLAYAEADLDTAEGDFVTTPQDEELQDVLGSMSV